MRMMIFSCLLALLPFNQALAQGAVHSGVPASTDAITDMDAVVVSGVQPGPDMWKVSKAGHVLWVLGVQSPLPRKMQWHSPEVEAAIAQSQEVLNQPGHQHWHECRRDVPCDVRDAHVAEGAQAS